ncbi:protoporphyrinogen oxidase [Williamsia sp. D3]|uniref:protoporphyrinogen oxidase n=1 Tax=Williamsia sp. D3 TaxID=1313067 RepID=UPI0003D2CB86|nr:protoporphyrinogen oxidase [Williamsia sp. D3]ETD32023.1 protoporphyrinogen oxidase [Williamsia sp. D3]
MTRVAVLGGGISGLTAAYRLRTLLGPDAVIDLFEASPVLGGTLRTAELDGHYVDVGAEAFLVRRPEVAALVDELGLTPSLVHPGVLGPNVLSGSTLKAMARPTVMGIPGGPDAVRHLAEADDLARMADEPQRALDWQAGQDMSIGALIGDRFGRSIVDRSVDPMLGGVYSARADDLGVRAVVPALAARLDAGAPSLTAAVTDLLAASGGSGPVFGALAGGYRQLVDELGHRCAAGIHTGAAIRQLIRAGSGWMVDDTRYDGVVAALPAPVLARVCATVPEVAEPLARVDLSGSAVVSLALEAGVDLPQLSGVLVASDESLVHAKAFTFSTRKWNHLAADAVLVRVSFGRYGTDLERIEDDQLIDWAVADLATVIALAGGGEVRVGPRDAVVQRWPGGLPRYAPGHASVVAEVDRSRPPGLVLAGATFDGVGVPACVGRADRAARQLVADLAVDGPWSTHLR